MARVPRCCRRLAADDLHRRHRRHHRDGSDCGPGARCGGTRRRLHGLHRGPVHHDHRRGRGRGQRHDRIRPAAHPVPRPARHLRYRYARAADRGRRDHPGSGHDHAGVHRDRVDPADPAGRCARGARRTVVPAAPCAAPAVPCRLRAGSPDDRTRGHIGQRCLGGDDPPPDQKTPGRRSFPDEGPGGTHDGARHESPRGAQFALQREVQREVRREVRAVRAVRAGGPARR